MQQTKQNKPWKVVERGYTRSDWRTIALASITLIPLILVVFFRVGGTSPVVVATVTGLSIVAAAFFLSWATEALETVVAQSVALALLALVEVAPEYTFEVILAYRRQTELASASMTGANRLLLGLGWPMIFFVAYLSSRWKGQTFTEIRLDYRNAPEILFLLLATLYAFVIVFKRSFSLIDSAILILVYILYILLALRTSQKKGKSAADDEKTEEDEEEIGVAASTKQLRGIRKWLAMAAFWWWEPLSSIQELNGSSTHCCKWDGACTSQNLFSFSGSLLSSRSFQRV